MMVSEETLDKSARKEKIRQEEIRDAGVPEFGVKNTSGIGLKPIYTPKDLEERHDADILSLPGQFPYTRGSYPVHYQVYPPMIGQQMSLGDGEQTRERREFLQSIGRRLHIGMEEENFAMIIAVDAPTFSGFDADEPEARGKVGECAASMCIVDELEAAYDGAPSLANVPTLFVAFNSQPVLVAMYAVYAMDCRKEPLNDLVVWPVTQLHCQHYLDIASYPPRAGTKLNVELIKWLRKNCPQSATYMVDGYNIGEAGAVPSFEVAAAFSELMVTIDACVEAGMDPDDFLPGFYTHFHLGINLFEEVAKFRAARRLWAKLIKERYGCRNPEALKLKGYVDQCAGYDTVAQEPLNNLVRNTVMVMAGMFSDLDGIHPIAYDEPLGIPNNESLMLSTRTMQILVEETDVPHVTDPLGGSYYVEWLTSRMEEEIRKHLKGIDDRGGFIKCYESGWLRAEVARQAYERMKAITSGEAVRVGSNKYRVEDKSPPMTIIRRPMELEDKIIAKVKRFKQERNSEKTKASLLKLREICLEIENNWPASAGTLMPGIIEAVRADATLGECCRVFREVFGYGYWAK